MRPSRPVCIECECYLFRESRVATGWEALCRAESMHGRVIAVQFGMDYAWTKKELKDFMEIRGCPVWCPKLREEKTNNG